MDGWLAFKNIQTSGGNALKAQGFGQRRVVHNAAARQVDQGGGGLHQRQLGSSYGVVGGGRIRQHQHHVVRAFQQLFLTHVTGVEACFGGRIQARAVVVDHLHAKAQCRAPGNGLADAAHTNNAQRGAMHLGAREHVVAPARPFACA